MKSVTEFWSHTLNQGLQAKTALATEGKTPEEINTALGEKFKYEGDKLKHFVAALDVASANQEKLSRVLVVSLTEGETAPPKAVKVEEHHYIPEQAAAPKGVANVKEMQKSAGGKGGPGGKGKHSGPKESPWGLSPEQKAAKKAGNKPPPAKPS